ncbi:MAG: hypothetical protein BGN88_10880 [Clostridiales bacterium 43-6]|nr:MAG: hypothetical protein BGN88_10880 [Clostridiales bacterium 43-6]
MFILILYRYLFGYVKFTARNGFSTRFLNLCSRGGITVWKTSCVNKNLFGYILAKDYKKLRPYARSSGVRLHVLERHGLAFILHRYRRRKGILVGAFLFFGVLQFLSLFIWNIQVAGNQKVDSVKILENLRSFGVYEGTVRSGINEGAVRQQLLMKMPELSWAAVNINGSFITVDVRETIKPPPGVESEVPCNIKATRDGRIVSMKVIQGTSMFQVGEAVVKGDLLVSGAIEHKTGVTVFKHAKAEVIAETNRELKVFVPFSQKEVRRTGKAEQRKVITVFGMKIPLFVGSVKEPYERKREVWDLRISEVRLPWSVTTATFYETGEYEVMLNETEAKQKAQKEIANIEKTEFSGVKILKVNQAYTNTGKGVALKVNYLCNENIAVEENMLINK